MTRRHTLLTLSAASFLAAFCLIAHGAEGPPMSNGVISSPKLVENQAIAKAQAAGAITLFMTKGTQECDKDGKNCKSLFGADDNMDFNSVQMNGTSLTGVDSYSFGSGSTADERMDTNTIATQMGTVVLACGDFAYKKVAGIAFKVTSCAVTAAGDAQMTFQVCSAPTRGNPIEPPEKVMECSTDPASADFYPKPGYSCKKPTCQTEPVGSENGWSTPMTISYEQAVAQSGTDDDKAKNGLGMVFYPALTGGTPSFSSDSDNMIAVKVVQTAVDSATQRTALGLRVAFRHKTKVTKQMMVQGPAAVPDPRKNTAAWETIEKLQGNALIPQYQAAYAANGSECLQQIQNGLATDGVVSVCDQQYTNESGIKPGALTAQMGSEGQNCGTTAQCLTEVVNTNTWSQTCSANVPLSIRKCTTEQDYEMETLSYVRTRTSEQCVEERLNAVYECTTWTEPINCRMNSIINAGGIDMSAPSSDTAIVLEGMVDNVTARYRFGAPGDNYWGTGYYKREFVVDIKDAKDVQQFLMYHVAFDDEIAIAVNGVWVWSNYGGGYYNPQYDQWGYVQTYDYCGESGPCYTESYWTPFWERRTSWHFDTALDIRPFLKEGRNVIRMDTGVVGGGEGFAYFQISAWKVRCDMLVHNGCSSYEAAR